MAFQNNISTIKVPNDGPDGAPFLIVGEAPGSDETRLGKPFVGKSGELLEQVLGQYGISRQDCKLINLCQYQPVNNDFSNLEGSQQLKDGVRELNSYIQSWKSGIKVCIALGGYPLQYLCNKYGITRWRGSIIQVDGLTILSTYHPAYILRDRSKYPIFAFDIGKAHRIYSKGFQPQEYQVHTNPSGLEWVEWVEKIKKEKIVSVDIETIRDTNHILCIGFGYGNTGICFPNRILVKDKKQPQELDAEFRKLCEEILEDENIKKIFHNGIYDIEILHNNGIEVAGFSFDTIVGQHILQPEFPRSLAFCTSIYTDIPYYKDKGRSILNKGKEEVSESEEKGWSSKLSEEDRLTLYEYNAFDVIATYLIYKQQAVEILDDPDYSYTFKYEMSQYEMAFHIMRTGMLIDKERNQQLREILQKKYEKDQTTLNSIVGHPINVASPKQKKELLYEEWKLPTRTNKDGKVGTGEDEIISLIGWTKDHLSRISREKERFEWQKKLVALMLINKISGYRKLLGSYIDIDIHPDGRARSTVKITGAETGRWSMSKYLDDTGWNAQTLPRESLEL